MPSYQIDMNRVTGHVETSHNRLSKHTEDVYGDAAAPYFVVIRAMEVGLMFFNKQGEVTDGNILDVFNTTLQNMDIKYRLVPLQ